ncbi:MAG: hypothetical protein WDW36_001715 [Sanguina aurantia]
MGEAAQVDELETNPEHALKPGDDVYILPLKWWHSWVQCSGFGPPGGLETPPNPASPPGPIDTTGLMHSRKGCVKDGLVLGQDYILVKPVVWEKLQQWYSCLGSPVSKPVVLLPGQPPMVHLYPISVSVICEAKDTSQRQTKRVDTDFYVTVGDFKRQCCEMFSVEVDSMEIFDYYSCNLHAALEPMLHQTFRGAKIMPEQSILLAPKVGRGGPTFSITVGGVHSMRDKSDDDTAMDGGIIHTGSSLWDSSTSTPATPIVTRSSNNTISNWNSSTRGTSYNDDSTIQDSHKGPGLAGLANLGNTCFMNSSLQCLSHAVPLMKAFLSGAYIADLNRTNALGLKGQLAEAFGALMDNLWKGGVSSVTPRGFKSKIQRFASQFTGYAQHDSQEFLAFLLDGLHEDINRVRVKPYLEDGDAGDRSDSDLAAEAWSNHLARNDSQVVDHFQGLLRSTLVCPQCRNASVKFDPYLYMSLPLPESKVRTVAFTLVPVLCAPAVSAAAAALAAAVTGAAAAGGGVAAADGEAVAVEGPAAAAADRAAVAARTEGTAFKGAEAVDTGVGPPSCDAQAAATDEADVEGTAFGMGTDGGGGDGGGGGSSNSGSGRHRQYSVEVPASASLRDFLTAVALVVGIQVPNVEEILLAAVVNRSIQELVLLHLDNTESLADVIGERRYSENRLVVYQYPCARIGPLGGGQAVVVHQKRKKVSNHSFTTKSFVSLPMVSMTAWFPRTIRGLGGSQLMVLWLPPAPCFHLSEDITQCMEPGAGGHYTQRKQFPVSASAPLHRLVVAALQPYETPGWLPAVPHTPPTAPAVPPPAPAACSRPRPCDPTDSDMQATPVEELVLSAPAVASAPQVESSEADARPDATPAAAAAAAAAAATCQPAGVGVPADTTSHTIAVRPPSSSTMPNLPVRSKQKQQQQQQQQHDGGGSAFGSGSNASWTLLHGASTGGGGSSTHGDGDDDGSGHVVSPPGSGHAISPQADSCRSSRRNSGCSSIADPGTPDTHDVLSSPQPGGMEDDGAEMFGDENLMVDEVDAGARVAGGEAGEGDGCEGGDWTAVAGHGGHGGRQQQRHGGGLSPRACLAAAAAAVAVATGGRPAGGHAADVEMTRVSLECLTAEPSRARGPDQRRAGPAGGSQDAGLTTVEQGPRMSVDDSPQQPQQQQPQPLPERHAAAAAAAAAAAPATSLPQQSPGGARGVSHMDPATAMLLTQAAAVFIAQQVQANAALQLHQQQQQQQHGVAPAAAAEEERVASEAAAYGPPPLAPFHMWEQPQAPPSATPPHSPPAGGSCDGPDSNPTHTTTTHTTNTTTNTFNSNNNNNNNTNHHDVGGLAFAPPFKLCLAKEKGEIAWSSFDLKGSELRNCRHVTVEWADPSQSSPSPYDSAAIDTPEEDPSATAARERLAAGPKNVSLSACVSAFLQPEQLGKEDTWFCGKCKQHVQAEKKLDIWSLPQVLIIHLKRFSYSRTSRDKLDTRVEYPLEGLDLSSVVMTGQQVPPTYDLFAVSNHFGSLGGGHYTAYACLPEDRSWYCYDDSHVSPADPLAVANNSAAYVLFYRRRAEAAADPPGLLALLGAERCAAAAAADAAAEAEAAAAEAAATQQQLLEQPQRQGACSSGEGEENNNGNDGTAVEDKSEDGGNVSSGAATPQPLSHGRAGSSSASLMGGRSSEEGDCGNDHEPPASPRSESPELGNSPAGSGAFLGLGLVGRSTGFSGVGLGGCEGDYAEAVDLEQQQNKAWASRWSPPGGRGGGGGGRGRRGGEGGGEEASSRRHCRGPAAAASAHMAVTGAGACRGRQRRCRSSAMGSIPGLVRSSSPITFEQRWHHVIPRDGINFKIV